MEASIIVASLALFGTIITAILSFVVSRGKFSRQEAILMESRFNSIENKIELMQNKIDPVWNAIMNEIPKLLIRESTPELDELIKKSTNGLKEMTLKEIHRLLHLLDVEFKKAVDEKDTGRAIGIVFTRIRIKADSNV